MTTPTAKDLIAQSIRRDEITHAPHTVALHDELLILCGDYVENLPTVEFWGETDDGQEWRVHLDGFGSAKDAPSNDTDSDLESWNAGA